MASIEANLLWVRAFLRRDGALLLPVALAFLGLPPLVLALLLPPQLFAMPQSMGEMQALSAALPGWVFPALLAGALVTMTGALAISALALTPRISVGEAIATALRRLPAWLGAALLIGFVALVLLVAVGTVLVLAGLGQAGLFALMVLALLGTSLFLILLLPVVVHGQMGPIAAIRLGWELWRPVLPRVAGACALAWAASWLVAFALQVALGSMLMMAALTAGQAEAGRVLAALWSTMLGALQWAFFYVFVAGLYRARLGASRGI